VTLPRMTLLALRRYWSSHRHPTFIFPAGKDAATRSAATAPMDRGGIQKSFKAIAKSCGIQKHVHIHTSWTLLWCTPGRAGIAPTCRTGRARAFMSQDNRPLSAPSRTQLTETTQQSTLDLVNTMVNRLTISLDGES
jgi:integrase/recombinase XerD